MSEVRSIIYAPSQRYLSASEFSNIAVGLDCQIIDCLLANFDFDVVYQPHPKLYPFMLESVMAYYSGNPRLTKRAVDCYADQYANAAALVTDFSQAALAFSLFTLRPSVFYSPLSFDVPNDLRLKLGFVVTSLKEMVQCVQKITAPGFSMATEIQEYKYSEIFNFS